MTRRIGALALGVLLLACSDLEGPSLSGDDQLVLQILPDFGSLPNDAVTITAARVEARTLYLTLRYGGGCKTHRFALVAGATFGESLPLYTTLRLAHDANGDPCEALLERHLQVDLSPIVPLVQQGGGSALRFDLIEPGDHVSAVGELLLTF